jgi:hypothetical protein
LIREPRPNRPVQRALRARPALLARYSQAKAELSRAGASEVSTYFENTLQGAKAAVNMKLRSLSLFLAEGRWLNRYELVARDLGLRGRALDERVERDLKDLGVARLGTDKLLGFRHDTHYAYTNIGGLGPDRYGACAVILDLERWAARATCFAGDSLLACFTREGRRALSRDEALSRFAVAHDLPRLGVVHHLSFLARQDGCLDLEAARALIEGAETVLELHLHGPVLREHVLEVRIPHKDWQRLRSLSERLAALPEGREVPAELEPAVELQEAQRQLKRFGIPLLRIGGN